MTLAEQILQEIEQLPPEQQQAVLDYATLLKRTEQPDDSVKQREEIQALLKRLAAMGTFKDINDPVEWQQQERQ
jgi:hypothetical protein